MRKFKKQIFMGNGDASMGEVYKLLKRVDDGCSILSGLQQMESPQAFANCKSEKNLEQQIEEAKQELCDVVQDVAVALRGKKIKFKTSSFVPA